MHGSVTRMIAFLSCQMRERERERESRGEAGRLQLSVEKGGVEVEVAVTEER